MNIVDSCGWIEYFWDRPGAEFFAPAIQDTGNLLVPVICLYEVCKYMMRHGGKQAAVEALSTMHNGTVVNIDERIALEAAIISHDSRLPMADSLILATARAHNATLWTQDAHFEGVDGVKYRKNG